MMQDICVFTDERPQAAEGVMVEQDRGAFVLVKSGWAEIEIDFRSYRIATNNLLLLIPASQLQYVERSTDFSISYVSFSEAISQEVTANFEPTFFFFQKEYPVASISVEDADFISHQITGIRHVMERSHGEHQMQIVKNMIQCFYLELYDRTKENFSQRSTKNVSSQEYIFMRFLMLVHKHADRERDLPFYADHLCITTRYLSSIVRNQTGRTAKDFIDSHCIQDIKRLLRTTKESLQNIALRLNFPDASFFSRYFKKLTGMTPSEFRAK